MKNFLQHFILLVAISIFGLAIYQNGLQTNADWQCGENGLWNGSTCDCDPGYSRPGEGYECELDYIPTYYGIDLYADPSTGGVIDGYGRYEEGQEASISAIPNTGYIFSGWRRYGDNSRVLYNPYVFDMWNDEEFTAYFSHMCVSKHTFKYQVQFF